jgi:hypothetical protein
MAPKKKPDPHQGRKYNRAGDYVSMLNGYYCFQWKNEWWCYQGPVESYTDVIHPKSHNKMAMASFLKHYGGLDINILMDYSLKRLVEMVDEELQGNKLYKQVTDIGDDGKPKEKVDDDNTQQVSNDETIDQTTQQSTLQDDDSDEDDPDAYITPHIVLFTGQSCIYFNKDWWTFIPKGKGIIYPPTQTHVSLAHFVNHLQKAEHPTTGSLPQISSHLGKSISQLTEMATSLLESSTYFK